MDNIRQHIAAVFARALDELRQTGRPRSDFTNGEPGIRLRAPLEVTMSEDAPNPVQVGVSVAQLELIDRFQREAGLPTREAALQLLLDVAFEAVTSSGRRFWDKPIGVKDRY